MRSELHPLGVVAVWARSDAFRSQSNNGQEHRKGCVGLSLLVAHEYAGAPDGLAKGVGQQIVEARAPRTGEDSRPRDTLFVDVPELVDADDVPVVAQHLA